MIRHAWTGYYTHARGSDELCPQSKRGHNWTASASMLFTPVDSLDTLLLAGLKTEFAQAKALVVDSLDFDAVHNHVNAFETTIRILGGLLSGFELDGDKALLAKAKDLADRMINIFNTPTGFPNNLAKVDDRTSFSGSVSLATAGTHQIEYQYLSDVTGDLKYAAVALHTFEQIHAIPTKYPGLAPMYLNTFDERYSVAGESDSYYEYLLKLALATHEPRYRQWYDEASLAIEKHLLVKARGGKVAYLPNKEYGKSQNGFHHLSCFAGGMFALGAVTKNDGNSARLFEIGAALTRTCFESYQTAFTKLGGEWVNVDQDGNLKITNHDYLLRPEVVESIFVLWRLTHDQMYRDMAWAVVQALDKRCKTEAGYHGLDAHGAPHDRQESFFLAETLKYLYLTFSDDDVLPLEQFVLNTEAHPVSIRGFGKRKDPKSWVPIPDAKGLKDALPW
ncbi:hypothetical protein HK105_202531 [Polyrhizophydium stewartii]|uniref:alpha-1,2-Mannosidase n=1 Tax=Polyrhizophydium stewartii TaxID=2732419 RepID=A0ABR4NF45_9FUNG